MEQARGSGRRVCACGARLSSANTGTRCAVCERDFVLGLNKLPVRSSEQEPPVVRATRPRLLPRKNEKRVEFVGIRKAAGLTQEQLAERLQVDRATVLRWEAGSHTPLPYLWPKLAKLLGVSSERLAELLAQQPETGPEHITAKPGPAQVATSRGTSVGDVCAPVTLVKAAGEYLDQISVETPVPGRIGWSDVEHIRSTTRAVANAENVFGGGLSCEAAMGQLRWAGKLLDARADWDVRHAMFEAVGNLSSVVAYSAFDVSAYDAADRCFCFTLWCADQSGSWALRANTLAEMSRKATYLGDLDDALSMIEFAQVRSDRLTNTAKAMLCTLRARLLALTNRYSEARSDIARADSYFHDGVGEESPPWLTYYDMAEHQGSTGKALIPIARAERDPDVAAPRLREAITLHRTSYPRSRAFSRTRLATLAMHVGDPREAAAMGRQLLEEVAPLRSDRIARELRGLAHAATRHSQIGDVVDLRHNLLALT